MGRPKKESHFDRRTTLRLSGEVYAAYKDLAQAIGVPVGQLMRQVLTLEAQELRVLLRAFQQSQPATRPFEQADAMHNFGGDGGLSQRLRHELLKRQAIPPLEFARGAPLHRSRDVP